MTNRILFLTALILWSCSSANVYAQDNQPSKKPSFEISTWKKGEKPPEWVEKESNDIYNLDILFKSSQQKMSNWLLSNKYNDGLQELEMAAHAGHPEAMIKWAMHQYKFSEELPKRQAISLLKKHTDKDHNIMFFLAEQLLLKGQNEDAKLYFEALLPYAEESKHIGYIAAYLISGRIGPEHIIRGKELLEVGLKKKNAHSFYLKFMLHYFGKNGYSHDKTMAYDYLETSISLGSEEAIAAKSSILLSQSDQPIGHYKAIKLLLNHIGKGKGLYTYYFSTILLYGNDERKCSYDLKFSEILLKKLRATKTIDAPIKKQARKLLEINWGFQKTRHVHSKNLNSITSNGLNFHILKTIQNCFPGLNKVSLAKEIK